MDLQPAGPAGPVRAAQQYGHGPGPPLSALLVCPWWLRLHLSWCCVRAEPHPLLPVPCLGVPPGRVSLHALPPAIAADYAFSEGRRLVARCQDGDATALLEIVEVSCALTPCGWRRLSRPTLAPRTLTRGPRPIPATQEEECRSCIRQVTVLLTTDAINRWFGTKY